MIVVLCVCAAAIAALLAVGWVVATADSAPNLSQLNPQPRESSDRDLRVRRDAARLRAHEHGVRVRRPEPDPQAARGGDGRDRGPALLPARGARLPGDRPRRRQGPARRRQRAAGRLDADDAARQQHVHPAGLPPASRPQVQDRAGQAGRAARVQAPEVVDPRLVPERRPVRHFERRGGGRRRRGRADVLQPAGVEAQPGADVAARGAAAVADSVRPARLPQAREGPAQLRAAGDGDLALHQPGPRHRGREAATPAPPQHPLHPAQPAVHLRLRRAAAGPALRR